MAMKPKHLLFQYLALLNDSPWWSSFETKIFQKKSFNVTEVIVDIEKGNIFRVKKLEDKKT